MMSTIKARSDGGGVLIAQTTTISFSLDVVKWMIGVSVDVACLPHETSLNLN